MKRYRVTQITFSLLLVVSICILTITHAHSAKFSALSEIEAPPIPVLAAPTETQTLYRIDPNQSQASYSVQEVYVGTIDGKLVVGETNGIAGDVLIDWNDFTQSQLGMITVDVEQLTSDSRQRDRQIRRSYLESSKYPEATFIPEEAQAFPSTVGLGESVQFVIHGFLTVKDITVLSDWTIDLTLKEDKLLGRATTTILMSDFGVGPISIVGLLATEDEMQLTLEFVALPDGEISTVVTPPAIVEDVVVTESNLMFSDIHPIIETKCVGCHLKGEIGHGIYPMETVADVVDYAEDLALVIETGFMPPWSPSHLTPQFKNDRSLSEFDKAALLEWIAAGAPNDAPLDEALVDRAPAGTTLREDRVVMMPEPYEPTGELIDDYRCILIDLDLPDGGFVTGSQVFPGDTRVVHHVILFQAGVDQLEEAAQKTAEDDELGWECFGGTNLNSAGVGQIGNSLGGWVPGQTPTVSQEGSGTYVPPGGHLVMQVHYNYESGFYPDQTSAVLQIESADSGLTPVNGIPLIAPVEIPCPENRDSEFCDRDTSLTEMSEEDQLLAERLLLLCDKGIEDYEGITADNAQTSCDWRVPIDGEAVSIGGHMHTKGKSLRVMLNPDSDNPIFLQDLPIWDFNWQGSYNYETPIPVEQGDIVRISCIWDNTKDVDPNNARYVTWGEGTNDEMCLAVLNIKPSAQFEGVAQTELFINSVAKYPLWMPLWMRTASLALEVTVGITLAAAAIFLISLVAALIGLGVFAKRRKKLGNVVSN